MPSASPATDIGRLLQTWQEIHVGPMYLFHAHGTRFRNSDTHDQQSWLTGDIHRSIFGTSASILHPPRRPHTLSDDGKQFILLSPCGFLATSYVILPRLATWLDAEDCLFLKSRIIVRLFVWSDVITFLLQSSGGGMTAVDSEGMRNIGHWVRAGFRPAVSHFTVMTDVCYSSL